MNNGNILVVDNDTSSLKLISGILKKAGYAVQLASDGEMALRSVKAKLPALILLDIQLPGMDGYELCRRLKDSGDTKDIPIIFISSPVDPVDKVKAFDLGCVDYCSKPFEFDEMLARIATHLSLWNAKKETEEKNLQLQQEIVKRTLAEKELLEEARMRNTLLDYLPCIALVLKKGTREIIASNKAARKIGAVPGKTCYATCADRADTCPFCLAPDMWLTNEPKRVEIEYRGTYYEGIWVPLSDDLYIHYIFDITEHKSAENEILTLNNELEQRVNDRTAELEMKNRELLELGRTKSEFLDTVSHELRTPLTSIIGYSKLLLDGIQGDLTEKQTHYIDRIWTKGNHQLQLVNDLLDFSKLESGRMAFVMEQVSINAAISDAVEDGMPLLKQKSQEVIIEIADDVTDTHADALRLKQVLLNLISNAVKFTDDGGRIVIKADNFDDMVKISVTDDGIGIKKADLKKLFKRFVQVDQTHARRFGGTGLGLAIAKNIVELMGGWIDVESEYGKGSIFSVFIPQRPPESIDDL